MWPEAPVEWCNICASSNARKYPSVKDGGTEQSGDDARMLVLRPASRPDATPVNRHLSTRPSSTVLAVMAVLAAQVAQAGPAQCPPETVPFGQILSDVPTTADGRTHLSADEVTGLETGTADLRGNVNISRGDQKLAAERVIYDRNTDRVEASGQVVYATPDMLLEGDHMETNLATSAGTVENASYAFRERGARGHATRIIRHDGHRQTLEQATYTTCPHGAVSWQLRTAKTDIDFEEDVGRARHARIWFKGVPIAYTPYISFPLSDARKSGFLVPSYGTSTDSGVDVATPYYWNIAPNYDATLTPRYLSKRGEMVEGLGRYLRPDMAGEATAAFLPDDDRYGKDRATFLWQHRGRLLVPQLTYSIDYNYASDDEYFEDLGSDLTDTSADHLLRQFIVTYSATAWQLRANFQGYQTLDGTRPYQRLPQIEFETDGYNDRWNLEYELESELVHFDQARLVDGTRFDLMPRVSYPITRPAYFIEPAVALRYTAYDLNKQIAGRDDSPDRFTPIASLDAGLFFERDLNLWGLPLLQTLEPRAYYLYVPDKDQDDIPTFDTSLLDFGADQLFRDNRFSGPDRQGDANQLTLALTSRLLSTRHGTELLRATVGQIIYFDDRDVQLRPTLAADDDSSSEYVTSFTAKLTRYLTTRADWQWDPDLEASTKTTFGVFYRPATNRILNVSYRSRRGRLEQTDLSFAWPMTSRWTLVGRHNYSLLDNQRLEVFGGLQYESCCWVARTLYRRYVKDDLGSVDRSLMFQLELTGLGKVGNRIEEFLTEGILGYQLENYDR